WAGVWRDGENDQVESVLKRLAGRFVAGSLGEAGFEGILPKSHVEQGIAVELADLVPGECALAVILVVVGIGLDQMACELGKLARSHQLSRVWKSGRIAEGRFGQAELARAFGHQLREGGFVA